MIWDGLADLHDYSLVRGYIFKNCLLRANDLQKSFISAI